MPSMGISCIFDGGIPHAESGGRQLNWRAWGRVETGGERNDIKREGVPAPPRWPETTGTSGRWGMGFQESATMERVTAETRSDHGPGIEMLLGSTGGIVLAIVLTILLVILITELIEDYFHTTELVEGLLHVVVLSGTLTPLFYFFWFRPLKRQMQRSLDSREEARQLAQRLMGAEEEERRKIARDLHDEFGQKLTTLQIQLAALEAGLASGDAIAPERCRPLVEIVTALSIDLRDTLAELRPGALEELGLVAAVEGVCAEIEERHPSLKVRFEDRPAGLRFDPRAEIVLFRVCQEALTNIVKHSGASRAEVGLASVPPWVRLTVEDNGVGINDENEMGSRDKFKGRFGLIGMRERIASVGGSMRISTPPDGGTQIRVEVPLTPAVTA